MLSPRRQAAALRAQEIDMADGADRNDADLVVDARAGNTESFAQLFDRWFGPVLGAAQDLLGDRTEAARVATDTFQSVWLHLDELGDPEGFGAWVLLTSRTFARQRQAERDPSAAASPAMAASAPLFDNEDELRRAVAKVLVRRQVPALGALAPAPAASPGAAASVPAPPAADVAPLAADAAELAPDRLHRYHWTATEPSLGLSDRVRSFRLSPGTLVALAIVLLGSVIWLMSRDGTSEIDGGRPAPLFAPAAPTTIDGAAARADNGGGASSGGAGVVAPATVPPDPATPAPTSTVAVDGSRKVKVATVVPRATTPATRARSSASSPATRVTTVTTASVAPRTDSQPSTTPTVLPSSSSTTAATARTTTTTAESTTASTGRTTTTTARTTTTANATTGSTARTTTTTRGSTVTTAGATTTTAKVTTTAATASTTATTRATTTTSRPPTTTTRVTTASSAASVTTAGLVTGSPLAS